GMRIRSRAWTNAFWFYQEHYAEFEAKYHQRSNVESVFSAIKRKFGETLRSKAPTAQTNELLCKILAYNITCVILGMFEIGVGAEFRIPWARPTVPPLGSAT
ncbi:MAG: transposase, partial [Thermoplasmata archaeon]|nr:transposase [Thermoplasmata archaeon]